MSTTAPKPATTPLPVQLSAPECEACLVPHLSMPQRGPKGPLGYHRVFHRIVWGLSTGLPWQCRPVPREPDGTAARHDTSVAKVVATGADAGALWQAFVARVRPLAAAQPLARRLLPGDGPTTVAPKGAMAWATRATSPRKASRAAP
jgi:hypothetical protein